MSASFTPVLFAYQQIAARFRINIALASICHWPSENKDLPIRKREFTYFCPNKLCELLLCVLQLICQLKMLMKC
jgi:hypothetical protein